MAFEQARDKSPEKMSAPFSSLHYHAGMSSLECSSLTWIPHDNQHHIHKGWKRRALRHRNKEERRSERSERNLAEQHQSNSSDDAQWPTWINVDRAFNTNIFMPDSKDEMVDPSKVNGAACKRSQVSFQTSFCKSTSSYQSTTSEVALVEYTKSVLGESFTSRDATTLCTDRTSMSTRSTQSSDASDPLIYLCMSDSEDEGEEDESCMTLSPSRPASQAKDVPELCAFPRANSEDSTGSSLKSHGADDASYTLRIENAHRSTSPRNQDAGRSLSGSEDEGSCHGKSSNRGRTNRDASPQRHSSKSLSQSVFNRWDSSGPRRRNAHESPPPRCASPRRPHTASSSPRPANTRASVPRCEPKDAPVLPHREGSPITQEVDALIEAVGVGLDHPDYWMRMVAHWEGLDKK